MAKSSKSQEKYPGSMLFLWALVFLFFYAGIVAFSDDSVFAALRLRHLDNPMAVGGYAHMVGIVYFSASGYLMNMAVTRNGKNPFISSLIFIVTVLVCIVSLLMEYG